jgi:hypothetical protein
MKTLKFFIASIIALFVLLGFFVYIGFPPLFIGGFFVISCIGIIITTIFKALL